MANHQGHNNNTNSKHFCAYYPKQGIKLSPTYLDNTFRKGRSSNCQHTVTDIRAKNGKS